MQAHLRTIVQTACVSILTLALSCSRGPTGQAPGTEPQAPKAAPAPSPYHLRGRGKINADRDTKAGYAEAAVDFRRLVELEPDIAANHLNLAKVLLFAEDTDGCDRHLQKARGLFGAAHTPPDVEYLAGLCEKRRGRLEAALGHFLQVLAKRPEHPHAWFQRGLAEERLERFDAAERSYRTVLAAEPRERAAAYRLAMVLRRIGRIEEARELLARLPPASSGDREQCDLTAVTRRLPERDRFEPPAASISWTDVTGQVSGGDLPGPVSRAIPFEYAAGAGGTAVSVAWGTSVLSPQGTTAPIGLLLLGPNGAAVRRLSGARETLVVSGPENPADAAIADFDNDGLNDLALAAPSGLTLLRGRADGSFALVPGLAGLVEAGPGDLAAFDADHDGDLDIVVAAGDGAACLFRNNGDGTFSRLAPFESLERAAAGVLAVTAHDLDQANDIDFVFAGAPAGLQIFLNRRDGSFTRVPIPALGSWTCALVEDLNNDGAPDAFVFGGAPGWACAFNADPLGEAGRVRFGDPVVVASLRCGTVRAACLSDIDSDGDLDVLLAARSGLTVLRNTAGGVLREEEPVAVADGAEVKTVEACDLTGDGVLDVILTTDDGRLVVLAAQASPPYGSFAVRLQGTRDNRNAIGAVVELSCGTLYQSVMVRAALPVSFGLGPAARDAVDGLRVRWPQGIVQAIPSFEIASARAVAFTQPEAVVSSCPFLYARGPDGWRFVTDVLGSAPLDEWLPPGMPRHLDPEEYVRIEDGLLAPSDGVLRLAVTEELRETAYLDRLELVAVEHAAERAVYVNESTAQEAYETLRLFVVPAMGMTPPASVVLEDGTDVTASVSGQDGLYAHGYGTAPSQWSGWVERHAIDITLAAPARALLLTGRIAWYDSTVAYALAQHGRTWGPLRLELVRDGSVLIGDLGLPAGMDRTMAAEFSGAVLPAGTRLRLSGHHRFLWDRLSSVSEAERVELTERAGTVSLDGGGTLRYLTRPVRRAVLGYHGFSKVVGDAARHEQRYVYDEAGPDDRFSPAMGPATRYGEVGELLREHDDQLVVLVAGDGVEVEFPAPPAPRPGTSQTYFLRVSGWAKEGAYHNRTGSSIEPLPRRDRGSRSPQAGGRPADEAYARYLETYQTRFVQRRPP